MKPTAAEIIKVASDYLHTLVGHEFDVLTVTKPVSPEAAGNLSKVISKLSPLLGNLIEFNSVEFLNDKPEFKKYGRWHRQDPGFPDTVFIGDIKPQPGIEIKAWFPLSTEITARFKDSQNHFVDDNTYVCMLAWIPEHIIYGKPKIIDVVVASARSIAAARDTHYHNPPDYLVLEPEDTKTRTRNLQQTNTNGYKWQSTSAADLKSATDIVRSWGLGGTDYKPTAEYQHKLRELIGRFAYRLDTNYAKMDRIVHPELETFKARVHKQKIHGLTVRQWERLFRSNDDSQIKKELRDRLNIKQVDPDDLLQ